MCISNEESPPAETDAHTATSDAGATRETDGDDDGDGETRVAWWEKIPDECRRKRETNPPRRDDDDDDDADDE